MSRRTARLEKDVRTLEAHGRCATATEAVRIIEDYLRKAAAAPEKADMALGVAEQTARRALDAIRHHRH